MMEWSIKLLVAAAVVWAIWAFLQPRFVFRIRIESSRPRVCGGKVTGSFLDRIAEVCREHGISRGWIGGVSHGKRIALRFSRQFPPASRQRLRNEWQVMSR
jgi:hypothetical protein